MTAIDITTETSTALTIETAAPTEVHNLVHAVREQIATTMNTLVWPVRHAARRKLDTDIATTLATVAQRKLQAAAEAELACFAQPLLAQRQVAAVQAGRNDQALRGIVSMLISQVNGHLFQIAASHEDEIDRVAGAWRDALEGKAASGMISSEEATRRGARLQIRVDRLLGTMEEECDRLTEGFRQNLHRQLETLAQAG